MKVTRVEKGFAKHAWLLLFVLGVFALTFGVMFLIAPLQTPIPQDALAGTGKRWDEVASVNPWLLAYTAALLRFAGSFTLALGIFGLAVT